MAITVILLLLLALGFILVEIFLVPGVGLPGIIGAGLMMVALFLAYQVNTVFGHYTLAGTAVGSVGLIFLAFRSKTWEKMSLSSDISSHVENDSKSLSVGDRGKTISRLNPIGNALFGDKAVEVRSKGDYIDANTSIEIITIEGNKIIVNPIK